MATSRPVGSNQKLLTCGICQEVYRSPRLLPCHHSFCLECLQGLANVHGMSFPCPVCRKPTSVPPGQGVQGFPVNFWITEEELEQARNKVGNALCPTHPMEQLIFLCTECDQAICIRCRLTKHNNHDSEDLSEVASRCKIRLTEGKTRLDNTIATLTKQLALAENNLKATEQKFASIKEQIHAQHDTLMVRVQKWRDEALQEVDTLAVTLNGQLGNEAKNVQHELDSLLSLQQRVQQALNDACDADVVDVEREMRAGRGSEEELARAEGVTQTTTQRPGLHCDVGRVTDDDIRRVIGSPVVLTMPNEAPKETMKKVYRCGKDGECREVHAMCTTECGTSYFAYGGIPPEYEEERAVTARPTENCRGHKLKIHGEETGRSCRITHKIVNGSRVFYKSCAIPDKPENVCLNSKLASTMELGFKMPNNCQIFPVIEEASAVKGYRYGAPLFSFHSKKPFTFDASSNQELCVLVEEEDPDEQVTGNAAAAEDTGNDTEGGTTIGQKRRRLDGNIRPNREQNRTVCLYRQDQSHCVATYTPPELPFLPTDVCFWRIRGQEKLLIADWMNDNLHVVKADHNSLQFERYLGSGNGDLVKPSALNTDAKGRLWIGCSNGWVLLCESLEEEEQMVLD